MRKKIVVIDDDMTILEIVQVALESEGYEVETFSNSFGATSKIINAKPDLLLVDINMPGLSGPGLVDTLKKFHRDKMLPMVFHSSLAEEKLKSLVKQHGAAGYISKGISMEQFLHKIGGYLAQTAKKRQHG
jgi:DNA-binding response OmpR family regulator